MECGTPCASFVGNVIFGCGSEEAGAIKVRILENEIKMKRMGDNKD